MSATVQPALVCLVAAAGTAAAATVGCLLARGSTAVPAGMWAVAAATAFGLESAWRAAGGLDESSAAACARLVVAALSLCPIMSVLGGKRPQHGVWQFIVATLAAIVALPAAAAILVRPGSLPDVHPLQRWFMLLVTLVAGMNYAATRHTLAAGMVVAGQAVLVRRWLPFGDALPAATWLDPAGAVGIATGAALAAIQSSIWPVRRRSPAAGGLAATGVSGEVDAIGVAFLALRETLGAAWSLRIMERFNTEAEARGWPCRLRFDGLHETVAPADPAWRAEAARTGRALLRRFVTPDWMRRHAPDPAGKP